MRFVQSQTDSKYCSYGLDSQGLSKHEALPLTTSLLLQWYGIKLLSIYSQPNFS